MKTNLNFQFVPVIAVAVTSFIGFLVAFRSAPNIAWGRLFIDAGVILSIFFLNFAVKKKPANESFHIASALRELTRGRYDTRLNPDIKGENNELVQAFNELATSLSDQQPHFGATQRPNNSPLLSWKAPSITQENHSHHPELGPVKTLNQMRETLSQYSQNAKKVRAVTDLDLNARISELRKLEPENNKSFINYPAPEVKPENQASFILEDLFDEYTRVRKENNLSEVSFDVFQKTIEDTRKVLLTQHECKAVKFDIVAERGEVALRPRLIR